jgi:hypothetical protein
MQLKMTIEDALRIVKDATRGMTIHEDSTGLRVAALVLAAYVETIKQEAIDKQNPIGA